MNEGQAAMANLMLFSGDVVLSHTIKVQHHLTFSTNKWIKHSFENFKSQCFATVSQKMVPGITSLSQNTYRPLQWEMGDKRGKNNSKSCTLHFQRGMVPPAFLSLSYIILLSMQREDEITTIQSSEKFLHSYISKHIVPKQTYCPHWNCSWRKHLGSYGSCITHQNRSIKKLTLLLSSPSSKELPQVLIKL